MISVNGKPVNLDDLVKHPELANQMSFSQIANLPGIEEARNVIPSQYRGKRRLPVRRIGIVAPTSSLTVAEEAWLVDSLAGLWRHGAEAVIYGAGLAELTLKAGYRVIHSQNQQLRDQASTLTMVLAIPESGETTPHNVHQFKELGVPVRQYRASGISNVINTKNHTQTGEQNNEG